jgi:hypothetical protein
VFICGSANRRDKSSPRPFAFSIAVAPDDVKCYSRLSRCADYGSRLLSIHHRLRLFVKIGFLDLETSVFDFGKVSQKFLPAFQKLFFCYFIDACIA